MNDNQKVMRVHVSEDKSFKVSAKKKNNITSLVTVGQTYYTLQHPLAGPIKKKNVGPDWKEAHQTRGLIIHDSMRKRNSLIVSLFIY